MPFTLGVIVGMIASFTLFLAGAFFARQDKTLQRYINSAITNRRGNIYIPDEALERTHAILERNSQNGEDTNLSEI